MKIIPHIPQHKTHPLGTRATGKGGGRVITHIQTRCKQLGDILTHHNVAKLMKSFSPEREMWHTVGFSGGEKLGAEDERKTLLKSDDVDLKGLRKFPNGVQRQLSFPIPASLSVLQNLLTLFLTTTNGDFVRRYGTKWRGKGAFRLKFKLLYLEPCTTSRRIPGGSPRLTLGYFAVSSASPLSNPFIYYWRGIATTCITLYLPPFPPKKSFNNCKPTHPTILFSCLYWKRILLAGYITVLPNI